MSDTEAPPLLSFLIARLHGRRDFLPRPVAVDDDAADQLRNLRIRDTHTPDWTYPGIQSDRFNIHIQDARASVVVVSLSSCGLAALEERHAPQTSEPRPLGPPPPGSMGDGSWVCLSPAEFGQLQQYSETEERLVV
ncbi:Hypothetical protein SMAX5B_010233 [Scophthalmus maximus]|uniref:Uncharacterized protein n=1 Tax=Scophthalmus maximus TaxID=52904 RepID=A0A2U9CAW7_SCOMX|nr:Hypothetical protein SMAX5B_010233 [Scophthalmus maximus]